MDMAVIGIRKEDKNRWERRAPLSPEDVRELIEEHSLDVWVERSEIRAFKGEEYREAGAEIKDSLDGCPVVLGVKKIPEGYYGEGKTLAFFSHTIKGQEESMPMLKKMMDYGCNLIDYEKIEDENGERLVFFGHHAGYAGMIDSFWALGKKLGSEGISSPFDRMKKMVDYHGLDEAKEAVKETGREIKEDGLPEEIKPLVIGFAGYGHVSQTAQELVELLPHREIEPAEIVDLSGDEDLVYNVVFREEDMVRPNDPTEDFELQDYYENPIRYHSIFSRYLPNLTVLMNCIYWDKEYPRFVTREIMRQLYQNDEKKLKVIGDISCDMEGSIEFNTHSTDPAHPVYTYDPSEEETQRGWEGEGPAVLAVDNLPAEIPRESSKEFSKLVKDFIPPMAKADYDVPFEELDLPPELKKAVVVYQGQLTPDYKYLNEFLEG